MYRVGITEYIERVVDGGCVVAGGAGRAEWLAARRLRHRAARHMGIARSLTRTGLLSALTPHSSPVCARAGLTSVHH